MKLLAPLLVITFIPFCVAADSVKTPGDVHFSFSLEVVLEKGAGLLNLIKCTIKTLIVYDRRATDKQSRSLVERSSSEGLVCHRCDQCPDDESLKRCQRNCTAEQQSFYDKMVALHISRESNGCIEQKDCLICESDSEVCDYCCTNAGNFVRMSAGCIAMISLATLLSFLL